MTLFDRKRMPPGVFRDEALDHLDELIAQVRSRCVATVSFGTGDQPRGPAMARALSQSHLHRCVEQTEAAALLCNNQKWLSALTVARGLMETVAAYHHLAQKIENVVRTGDVPAIYDILVSVGFATRDQELIDVADRDVVKATNILTQINALTSRRPSARRDYEMLSEHVHPNSLGVLLFFSRQDPGQHTAAFRTDGWIGDEAFKWVGASIFTLHSALDAEQTMEAAAQAISRLA